MPADALDTETDQKPWEIYAQKKPWELFPKTEAAPEVQPQGPSWSESVAQDRAAPFAVSETTEPWSGAAAARGIESPEDASTRLKRPQVDLGNGQVGTVRSIGVGDERGEWVIPTIVDGKPVENEEAVQLWKSGKNNPIGGPFKTQQEANDFAEKFHQAEARRISPPMFPGLEAPTIPGSPMERAAQNYAARQRFSGMDVPPPEGKSHTSQEPTIPIGTLLFGTADLMQGLTPEQQKDHYNRLVAGLGEGVRKNLDSFTSIDNLSLMGLGGTVGKLGPWGVRAVSAAFAALVAKNLPDTWKRWTSYFSKPSDERDPKEMGELISDSAIQLGMTGAAAYHALKPGTPSPGPQGPRATGAVLPMPEGAQPEVQGPLGATGGTLATEPPAELLTPTSIPQGGVLKEQLKSIASTQNGLDWLGDIYESQTGEKRIPTKRLIDWSVGHFTEYPELELELNKYVESLRPAKALNPQPTPTVEPAPVEAPKAVEQGPVVPPAPEVSPATSVEVPKAFEVTRRGATKRTVLSKNTLEGTPKEASTSPTAKKFGAIEQGDPEGPWRITEFTGDKPTWHESFPDYESAHAWYQKVKSGWEEDSSKGIGKVREVGSEITPTPPPEPPAVAKAGEGGAAEPSETAPQTHTESAKRIADKLRAEWKTKGTPLYTLPGPIIDAAVEVVAKAIEAGGKLADAIEAGVQYIRENHKGAFNEDAFRTDMATSLGGHELDEAKTYGIRATSREERAAQGRVEEVLPGKGTSAEDAVSRGRAVNAENPNRAEELLKQFEDDPQKRISEEMISVTRARGEQLQGHADRMADEHGVNSPEYKKAFDQISEWDKRTKPMQTEWHKGGMAQQGVTDVDTGSFTGLQRAFKEATDKDFNSGQRGKAEKTAKGVKKATGAATEAKQRLFSELDKDQAGMTEQEKRTARILNEEHTKLVIRTVKAENALRVAQAQVARALAKVQEAAAKAAEDAANKSNTRQVTQAVKAENTKRVRDAQRNLEVAKVQEAAAKKAADAINKSKAESLRKAVELEKKRQSNPDFRVWEAARKYLDQGMDDWNDLRNKVATDLGMTLAQVNKWLTYSKRTKYLADDLLRKQLNERRLREDAKRWLIGQSVPWIVKSGAAVPKVMFGMKVGFHGTVALGTHAPMVLFQPRFLAAYVRDFRDMYHRVGSKAFYEMQMQDLLRRPNYRVANDAGLVNDPFVFEDYSSPDTVRYFMGQGGMGSRGYSILKTLRQDMFDQHWNKLPKTAQIPEMATAIANSVNHATGVVKGRAHPAVNVGLFAPRLMASRAMWLMGDPAIAAKTFLTWKHADIGEKWFAVNQIKEKAWVVGTMMGLLALNQGVLSAIGSKQKINGILESMGGGGFDPMEHDFLKFKAAGMDIAYGNAMLSMARLPMRLWVAVKNEGKLNKIVYEDENVYRIAGQYLRSQSSPFASLGMDLAFGRDFEERPLPRAGFGLLPGKTNMPKRLRARGAQPYTWPEFWTERVLPIPAEEAVKEVWQHGLGMSPEQIGTSLKALATISVMAGTGARVSDDIPSSPRGGTVIPNAPKIGS